MFVKVKKERDLYFDFLKGVLILLVLLGHAIQYGNGNTYFSQEQYWDNYLMKAIYSFHMPLFSAVSGYNHFRSTRRNAPALSAYIKRWKKLTLPIVTWTPLVVICKMVTNGDRPSVKSVLYAWACDYWFIWAVLIGAGLVWVVIRIQKRVFRLGIYGLVMLSFLLTPDLLWIGAAFKYVVPFYILGYELARAGWHPMRITKRGAVFAFGIWIVFLGLYSKECYIYTSLFSLTDSADPLRQLSIDVFRYLIGAVGGFACCALMHWLWLRIYHTDGTIKEFVLGMGQHSLAIYILSTPLYLYIIPEVTYAFLPSILITVAVMLSVTIFCMTMTALLGKNKFISKLLLGE